jgi:hypothetical protein
MGFQAVGAAIPIVLATGIVRMVAPKAARSLIESGLAKKATKKIVDSMKGYIPKATKKEAENLAKKPAGTSPTSAPKPKNTGTGAGTRSASRAKLKRERDTAKKEEAAIKEKEKTNQRKIIENLNQRKITENLNKRNLPAKTNKPLTTTGGRSVTTTGGRSVTTTGGRSATKTGGRSEKVVGLSKEGARAANRASQVGTAGTESKNNENKIAPRPKPKPEAKTAPRPKPKPEAKTAPRPKLKPKAKTAPKPKPKPKEKFDTEGGLYKQYEFAEKRDLPIGGATQKYYDQMENVALNKKGGMIKKSAVKKRKGFSGRGVGAARRGF